MEMVVLGVDPFVTAEQAANQIAPRHALGDDVGCETGASGCIWTGVGNLRFAQRAAFG